MTTVGVIVARLRAAGVAVATAVMPSEPQRRRGVDIIQQGAGVWRQGRQCGRACAGKIRELIGGADQAGEGRQLGVGGCPPGAPSAPSAPSAPAGPWAPSAPAGPIGPIGPAGPCRAYVEHRLRAAETIRGADRHSVYQGGRGLSVPSRGRGHLTTCPYPRCTGCLLIASS